MTPLAKLPPAVITFVAETQRNDSLWERDTVPPRQLKTAKGHQMRLMTAPVIGKGPAPAVHAGFKLPQSSRDSKRGPAY